MGNRHSSKMRSDLDRKLTAAVLATAFPNPAAGEIVNPGRSTKRAADPIRPAQVGEEFRCNVQVGELPDGFNQSCRELIRLRILRFHAGILAWKST